MQLLSKTELIDKDKDKDKIKKIKKQLEQDFKKIDYAIDLNTNKVKGNNNYIYILDKPKHKEKTTDNNDIIQLVQNDYIKEIKRFNTTIAKYLKAEYTTIEQLNKDIQKFNKYFYQKYLNGFNLRVIDLLDEDIKASYLREYTNGFLRVQMQDINLYGIDKFLKSDLAKKIQEINTIIDNSKLAQIQKETIQSLNKITHQEPTERDKQQVLSDIMYNAIYQSQESIINKKVSDNQNFYDKIHLLYEDINKNIINIVNHFKESLKKLESNNIPTITDNIEVITTKTPFNKNPITKLPNSICYDFDIVKFFSNIYPNYKEKSIDDNRHKRYDYKAKLILPIETPIPKNLEDIRILNFLKNGNIQLYPIQSAIIDSAIKIRDLNGADSITPLLSIIKNYREDKTTRLPTKKRDLELYEDFLLFLNRCKAQFTIIDRYTGTIVCSTTEPISLLENTIVKGTNYGYWIGRSALNFFKDQYDKLEGIDTPKIHTHLKSKQYLNYSKSKNLIMDNIVQFIYPKVASMINSYQRTKKYQPKINISILYEFMILYKKDKYDKLNTNIIDKSDKNDIKEYVKSYLDDLKNKDLINTYSNDKDIFKIEINKDAKL